MRIHCRNLFQSPQVTAFKREYREFIRKNIEPKIFHENLTPPKMSFLSWNPMRKKGEPHRWRKKNPSPVALPACNPT